MAHPASRGTPEALRRSALVEIRAFPLQERGLRYSPKGDPEHAEAAGLLADSIAAISTPLQAVLRARGNASYHRNNELLAALDYAFNTNVEQNEPFFRRFVFELDTDASLNWYLSLRGEETNRGSISAAMRKCCIKRKCWPSGWAMAAARSDKTWKTP